MYFGTLIDGQVELISSRPLSGEEKTIYPESCGENRDPVQVIATTHSPYFLDLYRDHPDEVVIAQKTKEGGRFDRLSERLNIMEILGDAPLGEVWYSSILGGVPAEQ